MTEKIRSGFLEITVFAEFDLLRSYGPKRVRKRAYFDHFWQLSEMGQNIFIRLSDAQLGGDPEFRIKKGGRKTVLGGFRPKRDTCFLATDRAEWISRGWTSVST